MVGAISQKGNEPRNQPPLRRDLVGGNGDGVDGEGIDAGTFYFYEWLAGMQEGKRTW
jgi:hypothetical protein